MTEPRETETNRPKRAAAAAASSQIRKTAKPRPRLERTSKLTKLDTPDAPDDLPPSEEGGQIAPDVLVREQPHGKELFKSLGAYYKNIYKNDIVPAQQQHAEACASISASHTLHPALPEPPNISCTWTNQDEARVRRDWFDTENDEWSICASVSKPYGKLFRFCLHFAQCTPWDIVGIRTRLRFQPESRGRGSGDACMWSAPFCNNLSMLVTHQLWPTDRPLFLADHLAAAIQYAVILRTGDRRPWDPRFDKSPLFQTKLFGFSTRTDSQIPMQQIHHQVRAYLTINGEPAPPLSQLFVKLEKLVKGPDCTMETTEDRVYMVRSADFTTLIVALDNMKAKSGFKNPSTQAQHDFAVSCRPRGDMLPTGEEQLLEYHKIAILEEMRRSLIWLGVPLVLDEPSTASSPVASSPTVIPATPIAGDLGETEQPEYF
ncbi:hypothetical protein NLG97_g8814 [Lecanicillium saksenae]|uniref:Uncharacterized protein n=1 Tax=Lecanicillium saksenae TaxID=468837 RepID=A0ACC1QI01_9HYPO|nr:hypothetical protein NLG97_g8814 [Lecanicillium saksenae]